MNIEEIRNYCLRLPGVTERFPFDDQFVTVTVNARPFLLFNLGNGNRVHIKCDTEHAIKWGARFVDFKAGFDGSEMRWVTVCTDGKLTVSQVRTFVDHAYDLMVTELAGSEIQYDHQSHSVNRFQ